MHELNLTVSLDEANLILEGLGGLPYARVYELIDKIQLQARRQIAKAPVDEETNDEA